MAKSLYLINPAADFPAYFSAEVYAGRGLRPAAMIADLAITTVAAMVPDGFEVRLCDENVEPVDFDCGADVVGITGKISQWGRMRAIADGFRRRGTTVLIGGPYASLCPEVVAPHCDVLVQGEMEEIAGKVFSDLLAGDFEDYYEGTQPDLSTSPPGRWELYPNHGALSGCVQTSRGCPFQCEFCDVIQYLGRKQRHKPVANVLRELDDQYRLGYRSIFLADDNFTAYRQRAKELLAAIRDWNRKQERGYMTFTTQISIDAAKDDEMIRLLGEAGVSRIFIGIETPNEESLRESRKRQNLGISLVDQIQRFYDAGLMVIGGMIVGFDSDGPDIFERQYEFATQASLPVTSLGALVAPAATPLHDRMEREGRLIADGSEVAATPWSTNIVPKLLTQEQLLHGVHWLANKLYSPAAFGERVVSYIEKFGRRLDPRSRSERRGKAPVRPVEVDSKRLVQRVALMGFREAKMIGRIAKALVRKPAAFDFVTSMLLQYTQIRYMYEQGQFWETQLADHPAPVLDRSPLPILA
jgi:radical SAM superfamily enzyme YgiQ (UPF0313 family)